VGLLEEIDAVIHEVREAKPVPLSASAMINRKALLGRLEQIRRNAPEELKQARWVVQDREELITGAQAEIDKMRVEAHAERDRILSRTEIVAAASREADKMIEEAKSRARQIRMEAEDYVDAKLASFEVVLHKTLGAVTRGRESLRGRLDVAGQEVPLDEPGELATLPSDSGGFRVTDTGSFRRI
jgi:cell division septum initiation protein DivIVA